MKHWPILLCGLVHGLVGCSAAECENPDYTRAECRVVVENELARLRSGDGLEVRFQDPEAKDVDSWDAKGLLTEVDGRVEARVAGAGDFAISVRRPAADDPANSLQMSLHNVSPAVRISINSGSQQVDLGLAGSTKVELTAAFAPGEDDLLIRGEMTCPLGYTVAVVGDIQTNPQQFQRIVERLQQEADESTTTPLLAVVILGDLTELSQDAEFEAVDGLLRRLPVPVAVTPGNHDVYRSSRAIYNRTFGPGNHTFELCGTKFVLLDTGDGAIAPSVEGRLSELLDDSTSKHLVIGTHYPAYPGLTGNGWSREDQAQHLLVEAVSQGADLLIGGHVHALLDYPGLSVADGELRQVIVGTGGADQGAGLARYGYLRLRVPETGGLTTCFVEVPPPGTGGTNPPLDTLPNCE